MAQMLNNNDLEIKIDLPHENYKSSRFDWTGKIVDIKFKNVKLAGIENLNYQNKNLIGKGLYNEFGIDSALGFEEAKIGEWFHKIGVGLLKKTNSNYAFDTAYEIAPATFRISTSKNSVLIDCISPTANGYSYELQKEILLEDNSFSVSYRLTNTGIKKIKTDEYVHNFLNINNDLIGKNYYLHFPFELKPKLFTETVNPDEAVTIKENKVSFNLTPNKQFFFSNLSGGKSVDAVWELTNLKAKIGIREKNSFQTKKVNLWGWKHVISPELFFDIKVEPGKSLAWTRNYELFQI